MAYQNMSLLEDSDRVELSDYTDGSYTTSAENMLMYKTRFKDGQTGDEYSLFESRAEDANRNILVLDSPLRDMSFIVNKYRGLGIIEEKDLDIYSHIPWTRSGTWVWPFAKLRTVYVQNNKVFCELYSKNEAKATVLELVRIKVNIAPNSEFEFKAFVGPQDIDKKYVRHLLAKRFEFAGDTITQRWCEDMDKHWSKIKIEVNDLYVLTPFSHTGLKNREEMEDWS